MKDGSNVTAALENSDLRVGLRASPGERVCSREFRPRSDPCRNRERESNSQCARPNDSNSVQGVILHLAN